MAATNRPDILDPALVRPGRFDRQVDRRPARSRRAGARSWRLHARGKPLAADVDLDVLAGLTRGFSGADLANVLNEAALLAARRSLQTVPMAMVEEAVDRATRGLASQGERLSEDERRTIAYHETGHALVALALPNAVPPRKLTIAARGRSLGQCVGLDTHDRVVHSRSWLLNLLTVLLGGRAAEELSSSDPVSSAAGDLRRASTLARQMVCDFGMSDRLGPAGWVDTGAEGERIASPDAARLVDSEIRRLVDEAHDQALSVLRAWRGALDRVAQALLEKETLTAQELLALSGPPPSVRLVPENDRKTGTTSSTR